MHTHACLFPASFSLSSIPTLLPKQLQQQYFLVVPSPSCHPLASQLRKHDCSPKQALHYLLQTAPGCLSLGPPPHARHSRYSRQAHVSEAQDRIVARGRHCATRWV
ncbi:hypothetical protein BC832DRAFT_299578 [Gaertneriomyces semiglobifer]|nr:hypothetical protein BC832DRAFT_299578 [Gaertneriomyces semiglobifer]